MRKTFLIILLSLSLSACRAGPPWQTWMYEGPPAGSLEKISDPKVRQLYKEGWIHGCETGIDAMTNHWYKMIYDFKQDAYKAQDKSYYKGWRDAYDYCQRYIYQYERRSFI